MPGVAVCARDGIGDGQPSSSGEQAMINVFEALADVVRLAAIQVLLAREWLESGVAYNPVSAGVAIEPLSGLSPAEGEGSDSPHEAGRCLGPDPLRCATIGASPTTDASAAFRVARIATISPSAGGGHPRWHVHERLISVRFFAGPKRRRGGSTQGAWRGGRGRRPMGWRTRRLWSRCSPNARSRGSCLAERI